MTFEPTNKQVMAVATALVPFSYGAFEWQFDSKGKRVQPAGQPNRHACLAARAAIAAMETEAMAPEKGVTPIGLTLSIMSAVVIVAALIWTACT